MKKPKIGDICALRSTLGVIFACIGINLPLLEQHKNPFEDIKYDVKVLDVQKGYIKYQEAYRETPRIFSSMKLREFKRLYRIIKV